MSPSIHVVVVNWNTGPYLRRCLESIAQSRLDGVELTRVTVVDNDSSDGSADGLDGVALPLELVRNRRNAGFGAACNQGAAGSSADHLLFLNPDTELHADTLAVVARFMDSPEAADVGICGARVLDESGAPAIACARFPTLRILAGKLTGLDRIAPRLFPSHHLAPAELERSRAVDQVIGAFFLVRQSLFERLGGFDPRYFIYYEEVDLSLRARREGYRSYFLHEATVIHAGNVSSSRVPAARLYHSQRSRLLYARAHWPRGHALALLALTFTLEPLGRLATAPGAAPEILAAARRLAGELLRRRRRFGEAIMLPAVRPGDAGKRVLIVGELDGYANGQKPVEIEQYLRRRGHDVRMANAYYLGRARTRRAPSPASCPLRRRASSRSGSSSSPARCSRGAGQWGRRRLSYPLIRADLHLRRKILASELPLDDVDMVVDLHPADSELVFEPSAARKLYDCQTPWADELYFEGMLTERQHRRLQAREARVMEAADLLSYSWETYAQYSVEHYGISGRNFCQLNWGCRTSPRRVRFRDPPRIVFLSSLSSRFINLPLLARLSKLYPIDVYGGPPPDPAFGLNYLGWADPSVLLEYQIGLITISTDRLRRAGFSAKNLEYIAHGLPVLVPAWRRDMHLIRGSIPYTEEGFLVHSGVAEQRARMAADQRRGVRPGTGACVGQGPGAAGRGAPRPRRIGTARRTWGGARPRPQRQRSRLGDGLNRERNWSRIPAASERPAGRGGDAGQQEPEEAAHAGFVAARARRPRSWRRRRRPSVPTSGRPARSGEAPRCAGRVPRSTPTR